MADIRGPCLFCLIKTAYCRGLCFRCYSRFRTRIRKDPTLEARMVAAGHMRPLEHRNLPQPGERGAIPVADQPTKAMTLREAVEHIQLCPNGYGQDGCGVCCDRARAIVDALVNKYEDWCEWDGMRGSLGEDEARDRVDAGFREVRALERGEDPKP